MKKGLTEVVFILDKSGSMHGMEKDTIGGFNTMLKKQKAEPLTDKDYTADGCTALLDTIGGAIHHIGKTAQTRARRRNSRTHNFYHHNRWRKTFPV